MSDESFFKLKDFSRITNLSRKALLLYENIGLLIPKKVDQKTGYRYYSSDQIRLASIISLLRNFDIPIKDLKKICNGEIIISNYFEKSNKRIEYVRQQIRINHVLQIIAHYGKNDSLFSPELQISVVPQKAVLFTEFWGTVKDIQLYFALIYRYMHQFSIPAAGNSFTWYFADSTPQRIHAKTCCPVATVFATGNKEIQCANFSDVKVAGIRHFGSYSTINQTYSILKSLLIEKSWKMTGEYLETYTVTGDTRYCDASTFITEVAGVFA